MALPMLGSVRATVQAIRNVDLHGDIYHDLAVTIDGADGTTEAVRVPESMCAVRPVPGDEVELDLLMGQVQAVRRAGD